MMNEQNKKLLEDRKKKLEVIKQILDENDPMGLLSSGCLSNEYSQEVNLIEVSIREVGIPNLKELSDIVYNVFLKQFDEALNKAVCEKIARDI